MRYTTNPKTTASDGWWSMFKVNEKNKKQKQTCCFSYKTPHVRSSCLQMFFRIGVFKTFAIFTGKHLCWSLFWIKLHAFRPATLLKTDSNAGAFLWIRRNFQEQFILIEHHWWLLLTFSNTRSLTEWCLFHWHFGVFNLNTLLRQLGVKRVGHKSSRFTGIPLKGCLENFVNFKENFHNSVRRLS